MPLPLRFLPTFLSGFSVIDFSRKVVLGLVSLDILAHEVTLVLSAVVLVFWLSYSLMLWNQLKRGVARKDWWMSMVFYLGIGMLVLGNLILASSKLYDSPFGERVSIGINMLSMLVFIGAFYFRMKHVLKNDSSVKPKTGRKGRKR